MFHFLLLKWHYYQGSSSTHDLIWPTNVSKALHWLRIVSNDVCQKYHWIPWSQYHHSLKRYATGFIRLCPFKLWIILFYNWVVKWTVKENIRSNFTAVPTSISWICTNLLTTVKRNSINTLMSSFIINMEQFKANLLFSWGRFLILWIDSKAQSTSICLRLNINRSRKKLIWPFHPLKNSSAFFTFASCWVKLIYQKDTNQLIENCMNRMYIQHEWYCMWK